jgi:LuxR family transcriptional regulator, maltose regulon positive regulatory protein
LLLWFWFLGWLEPNQFLPAFLRLTLYARVMPKRSVKRSNLFGVPQALASEVSRPRVLKLLQKNSGAKLVALLAPSGYGKTTVLAQFVRALRVPVVWLLLGSDDAEVVAFASHVARGLAAALPEVSFSRWADALQNGVSPDGLARALCADLNDADDDMCLVLDETQHLSADAGRWLERFVRLLPVGHRVLLSGFDQSNLSLSRLVASGEAVMFGLETLRFTVSETKALLKSLSASADAETLTNSLDGWCVGVALAARGGTAGVSAEHLIEDCLQRLPDAIQDVLPEASVLEIWDEASVQRLGITLPVGWLQHLINQGLPLLPLEAGAFRPHDSLLAALETRLKLQITRHAELHNKVAQSQEENGSKLNAIRHYRLAGNKKEELRLAINLADSFRANAEYKLLRQLLENFDETEMPFDLLLRWILALKETGDAPRSEIILEKLYSQGHRDFWMLFMLAGVEHGRGNFSLMLERIDEGLFLKATIEVEIRLRYGRALALEALDRSKEGVEEAKKAVSIAERSKNRSLKATSLIILANLHAQENQYFDSERNFLEATSIFEFLGLENQIPQCLSRLSLLYLSWGKLDQGLEVVNRGLKIVAVESNISEPSLMANSGIFKFWQRNFTNAVSDLQRAIDMCPQFGITVAAFIFSLTQVDALRLSGNLDKAQLLLENCQRQPMAADPYFQMQLVLLEGFCAFSKGDLVKSAKCFEMVNEEAVHHLDLPRLKAYLAEIARVEGRLDQSIIEDLISSLDALGHDTPLRLDSDVLRDLYLFCIDQGWHADRFRRALEPVEAIVVPSDHLELSITTLGAVVFSVQGQAVSTGLAKSDELLVWLALHGAGRRDEIITALWNGHGRADRFVPYFKAAARQLRTALKSQADVTFDPLVFEGGAYQLHPRLRVTLDAALFEPSSPADALLNAYQGEFMPGFDSDWVLEVRARLQDQVLVVALEHAQSLELEEPERALEGFKRVLRFDAACEAAFDGLRRVYVRLGDQGQADTVARMKSQMLAREYGVN